MSFRVRPGTLTLIFIYLLILRSHRQITSDDEFALYSVVIFRRVHDEFIQKCRDNKYTVRDFVYSEDEVEKQRSELENADMTEKELWVSLLFALLTR